MRWTFHSAIVGIAIGLLATACSDRSLEDEEEEPPPDIEGLCHEHCVRVMECVWTPEIGAEFDTVEGCQHGCEGKKNWDECPHATEAMHACTTQYDCPGFARVGREGVCDMEIAAYSVCNPE